MAVKRQASRKKAPAKRRAQKVQVHDRVAYAGVARTRTRKAKGVRRLYVRDVLGTKKAVTAKMIREGFFGT